MEYNDIHELQYEVYFLGVMIITPLHTVNLESSTKVWTNSEYFGSSLINYQAIIFYSLSSQTYIFYR